MAATGPSWHAHSETEMDDVTRLFWELDHLEKLNKVKESYNQGKMAGVGQGGSLQSTATAEELRNLNRYCSTVDVDRLGSEVSGLGFDPVSEAELIRKCLKKKHYANLIANVGKRKCIERCVIAGKYKHLYGQEITALFRKELVGHFRILMEGMFVPTVDFLTQCLRRAMKGFGTNEKAIIDILVPCSNCDVARIKETYLIKFGRDLEKDLVSETSGHFRRLLVSLIQGQREPSFGEDGTEIVANVEDAARDAKNLYDDGEAKWGTDETTFNAIMCNRSWTQLRAIFKEYKKVSKKDIFQAIKSEFSGDIMDCHMAEVWSFFSVICR